MLHLALPSVCALVCLPELYLVLHDLGLCYADVLALVIDEGNVPIHENDHAVDCIV